MQKLSSHSLLKVLVRDLNGNPRWWCRRSQASEQVNKRVWSLVKTLKLSADRQSSQSPALIRRWRARGSRPARLSAVERSSAISPRARRRNMSKYTLLLWLICCSFDIESICDVLLGAEIRTASSITNHVISARKTLRQAIAAGSSASTMMLSLSVWIWCQRTWTPPPSHWSQSLKMLEVGSFAKTI